SGWHEQHVTVRHVKARPPGFGNGWNVRRERNARGGRDRERTNGAILNLRQDRGQGGKHRINTAGDEVVEGGTTAGIGPVRQLDARDALEQLASQVLDGAGAW